MNQKRNIIISLQDKSDGEIKQIINNNTLNYVNLALNIHGELNIGNMSLDDTVKVLQARLSGGQMESRGGRTIAFSGEELKIMGQTLEHLKNPQGARVGVQSMETASKVMEGMGQALKVMRSIR